MPMRLLQSAATLVVIGWVLGMLLQARGAKETA
jgi:hypothetical protein